MSVTKKVVLFASLLGLILQFAYVQGIPVSEEIEDGNAMSEDPDFETMCDCEDPDALYYKFIREFMNHQESGKRMFLKEFRPKRVCGSDGIFYRSRCALECAKLKVPNSDLHPSKGCSKQKRFKKKPIKSMELKKALVDQEQIIPKNLEKQIVEQPRVCICARNYSPVCASNGRTYGNMCVFRCAKETLTEDVTIVRHGTCDGDDETFLHRQIK